jgi:hypothetical protein
MAATFYQPELIAAGGHLRELSATDDDLERIAALVDFAQLCSTLKLGRT